MPEANRTTLTYRVLRYTPNLVRDEWVNVGVLLEDPQRRRARARLMEDESELVRVRRLHPNADEALLRALPAHFESQLTAASDGAAGWIAKLDDTLANVLQFSSQKGVLAEEFDAELDRLYQQFVALPPRLGRGTAMLESTRVWIRAKLSDVFRRHKILGKMQRGVKVEAFTQAGDPMRIDYAYRMNGTRGYVQALSLGRDPAQAKVLAYTAERIRAKHAHSEFTAITEVAPLAENSRHQFVARLFDEQKIAIVPLPQVEMFAERLRARLQ
ncbi:MAG TPA: DUF3037 domain-containing protein [Candidatus Acidoferrales bacterium]|nr:DUF3037 domain-containing protein [Candidatus Acidoferrales bacterium]